MSSENAKNNQSKYRRKGRSAKSYVGKAQRPAKSRKPKKALLQKADQFVKESALVSVSIDHENLPARYYETFVTIAPKDPFWLYAYWEIDDQAESKARTALGKEVDLTYTLRVYDITHIDFDGTNANEWIDYDGLHMNNRYVNVKHDDATYCAEVGVRTEDGRFFAFSRSNILTMPRQSLSRRNDLIWKEYDQNNAATMPYVNVLNVKNGIKAMRLFKGTYQNQARRVSLSLDDVMNYYRRKSPLLELLKERWSHLRDSHGVAMSDFKHLTCEQAALSESERELLTKVYPVGSSDNVQEKQIQPKRTFDFELKTELVVSGRTDPDADVYWGNKKISLDHNGQFKICIPLNEGAVPLDFKAVAADQKSSKHITTQVTRTRTNEDYHYG